MNNLTKEQMLELAKIVTGEKWLICRVPGSDEDEVIHYTDEHGPEFNVIWSPSLTGEDWQIRQAVDVLNNLAQGITSLSDTRAHIILFAIRDRVITPAALALISGGRSS